MSEHNEDTQAIEELPKTNEEPGAVEATWSRHNRLIRHNRLTPSAAMAVRSLRWKVKSPGETGLTPLETTNENSPKEGDPPANKGSDRWAQIQMFKYDKKGLGDRTELIRQRLARLQGEKEDWARKEKKWEEERKEWETERQLYEDHILDLQKTINDASEYLTSISEDLVVKLKV